MFSQQHFGWCEPSPLRSKCDDRRDSLDDTTGRVVAMDPAEIPVRDPTLCYSCRLFICPEQGLLGRQV
jgi:hypothetical protein